MKDTTKPCKVAVCDRQAEVQGLCGGHYKRLLKTGDPGTTPLRRHTKGLTPEEKFAHYVDTSGGQDACHPWTGPLFNDSGYGAICIDGKQIPAHRWILGQAIGRPLVPGEEAMHSCDNPPCCNVHHLSVGTHADNMDDMAVKGRGAGRYTGATHCVRGHELSGENLRFKPNGDRRCRACTNLRQAEARKRARLAAAS